MIAIDFEKMFEEGGKEFDLLVSQAGDDGSDKKVFSKKSKKNETPQKLVKERHSCDVLSVKVEGKRGKEISFDDVYVEFDAKRTPESVKSRVREDFVNNALKKSVIGPDFEKLESVPPYEIGKRKELREKREKRNSTKGKGWYDMKAVEMTDEIKHDLQVLKMRSALDPKHFYKKNDMKHFPKYFHVGTVVESPADFYSSRIPKKQRKQTMVDELLADAEFQRYNKQRYKEIIEERQKTSFKAHLHASRLKRNSKNKKIEKTKFKRKNRD